MTNKMEPVELPHDQLPEGDYYEILGVEEDATEEEIQAAFRKLSQRWHPDREGGNSEIFKEVRQAWEVLSSQERRAAYDSARASGADYSPNELLHSAEGMFKDLVDRVLIENILNANKAPETVDWIAILDNTVQSAVKNARTEVSKLKAKISRLEKSNRFRKKKSKDSKDSNVISSALERKRKEFEQQKADKEKFIATAQVARTVINRYEFDRVVSKQEEGLATQSIWTIANSGSTTATGPDFYK